MQLPFNPWPNSFTPSLFIQYFWINFSFCTGAKKLISTIMPAAGLSFNPLLEDKYYTFFSNTWMYHHFTQMPVGLNMSILETDWKRRDTSLCFPFCSCLLFSTHSYLWHFKPPDVHWWPVGSQRSFKKNNNKEHVNLTCCGNLALWTVAGKTFKP